MKQTALITGAAKRIGKGIALFLAKNGFDIIAHYNQSEKEINELTKQISQLGQECWPVQYDLTNTNNIESLVNKIYKIENNIDLIIHNASSFDDIEFKHTTEENLKTHFNVHLFAPLLITKFYQKKQKKNGNIIFLIDSNIKQKKTNRFAYLMSKKSVKDFIEMAAHELAPKIQINGILPGYVLSPSNSILTKKEKEIKINESLMKKQGSIKDICQAIDYLISNNFITGTVMDVSGGKS